MIVFSAITPHPPILIPAIGDANLRFVEKTIKSMVRLSEELYASNPETIIIITPHGQILPDAFSINMAQQFEVNFKDFGDLKTSIKFPGDVRLIHHYKEILEAQLPIVLVNQPLLDHGAGVPLYFFAQGLDNTKIKIVPMAPSLASNEEHYQFGMKLQEDIINDTRRIAVIASGDLSHRLSEAAPAGFSHWAKKFDETIINKIKHKDNNGIIKLDNDFTEEVGECGLRPIITLLGILNSVTYQPEIYSYEAPFGVGYLTVNMKLAR